MKTNETRNLSFPDLLDGLLQYLGNKSYSQGSLDNYRRTLCKIEPYMIAHGIDEYTPSVGTGYYEHYLATHELGQSRQKAMVTAIRRLNDFHSGGEYTIISEHNIELLSDDYERVLDMFVVQCIETGNKPATIKSKKFFIRNFLNDCISNGCMGIHSLDPSCVCKACLMVGNKDAWAVIRSFFRFLNINGLTEFDLSTLVPHYKKKINIPTTYSEEEILKFEKAIDCTSNIGKRDYAMLILATRLGMRSGDIVKISMNDLDFKSNKINFIQQKTGEMLQLPMLPEVRDSLIDYISSARPDAPGDDAVFLRHSAPYQAVSTSVLRFVTTKYFKKADIDISCKKHGPHVFRSSLASSMVNDDVPYDAVRKILGHSDPDAIKHYAKLDIEKLRECAIMVPKPSGSFKIFLEGGAKP